MKCDVSLDSDWRIYLRYKTKKEVQIQYVDSSDTNKHNFICSHIMSDFRKCI